MDNVPVRRLGAEALGALILTLFGGAAVIGSALTGFAANLLGPLAFGLALFTAVNVIGPISGAHCNPTVTLALALRGRFAWRDVPGYVVAQIIGGLAAGLLLFFVYGNPGVKVGLATTHVAPGVSGVHLIAALLAEALGTFLLCYAVIALTDPDREGDRPVAFGIGLALTVGALAVGGLTGGSFNFARTFGPELVYSLTKAKGDWGHMWIYLLGPVIGAVAAAYLHRTLSSRTDVVVAAPEVPAVPTSPRRGSSTTRSRTNR